MDNLRKQQIFIVLLGLIAFIAIHRLVAQNFGPQKVSYSQFLSELDQGKIESAEVRSMEIIALMRGNEGQKKSIVTERIPGIEERAIVDEMRKQGVDFSGKIESASWWEPLLYGWIIPIGFMILIYSFVMRRVMKRGGPLSFGKSEAKIYDQTKQEKVTFRDVAGVDEAREELVEVVDFLKNASKYQSLGARIPKGVLLVGPPGTGKTLLAKAVAGEAGVPFFSISGSGFVEMFVGVGAARMRDMFRQAKERAPCIVFIDELDAIGKSRGGVAAMATHDEREQTLNQLLVEMDGFDASNGVVLMAATNRPEVLDQALIRPGRFDRQVLVDRPDIKGREDILKVHARNIKISPDVDCRVIAQRTPGMVGADLANIINESALAAARRGAQYVEQEDLVESIDRIQLGLKKRNNAMNDEERKRVAYHEGGHALVAMSVDHADPVHRVTIIPRSIGALGVTLQLPTEERYLMTREELLDRICVMLGGRAAEEIVCGNLSTGAQNDLERATETARQMVCRFGMSATFGAQTFGKPSGSRFLDMPVSFGEERNFSEQTAQAIDAEIHQLLKQEHERALRVIQERRDVLETMAERLLEVETLDRDELDEFARHAKAA